MDWGPAERDPGLGTNPVTVTVTSRHPKQGEVTQLVQVPLLTDGKLGGGLRSGMGGPS